MATQPAVRVHKPITSSPDFDSDEAEFFLRAMANRVSVSYHKYGSIQDNFPHRRTGLDNCQQRIEKYKATGNKEFLVDAANYLWIEFLLPCLPEAFFRPTDSDESPGAVNVDGSISHGKDRTPIIPQSPARYYQDGD